MASVLARLISERIGTSRVVIPVTVLLLGSSLVHADYQEPSPLEESEVSAFVAALGRAIAGCDADTLEGTFLPTARLIFEVKGESPVTVGVTEFMEDFRKNCFHEQESFDNKHVSLELDKYRAILHGHWSRGSQFHFFFLEERAYESIEQTITMIRYGTEIKVQQVRSFEVPIAADGKSKERQKTDHSRVSHDHP